MVYIRKLKVKLGEILLQISTLSAEQLKDALITQSKFPARVIGDIMVEKGYISKEDVETAFAVQEGYPFISAANFKMQPHIFKKISSDLMWKFTFIPLDLVMNDLTIAISSLANKAAIIEALKNYKVRVFISTHKEITQVLTDIHG
jgi:type IV pilus assembly protein PilB